MSTSDATIVGFEALLRWRHPTQGDISPAQFVPVAEECGLIEPIGEWVMRTACLEAASWPRPARVAVNVSSIQFAKPHLPALVAQALAQSGLAPERLELEITESVFLSDDQESQRRFAALKALGIRLALDDFGTGYSSLGYLRHAPFDKIKIDQSFVRGAVRSGSRNAAIIRAIVTLADTLGMETTAEGWRSRTRSN
ncbi:EAL domain-containing protein [Sphingomonas sp. I4]